MVRVREHVYFENLSNMATWACAARTAPTKKKAQPQRKGTKATTKKRLASNEFELYPDEATIFCALAARANDLAQDCLDINFSNKELCKEFDIIYEYDLEDSTLISHSKVYS